MVVFLYIMWIEETLYVFFLLIFASGRCMINCFSPTHIPNSRYYDINAANDNALDG